MKHNVLVITYWSFKDALVQTYTLPYVKMIRENIPSKSKIFLFTREQAHFKMSTEEWLNTKTTFKRKYNIVLLRSKYKNFGLAAQLQTLFIIFRLWVLSVFRGVKTIHTWCTPAGVLGYLLKRITGKGLVLDSFEPHAEVMLEGGTWTKDSRAFKMLFGFERRMLKKADNIIACTPSMQEYSKEKYGIDRNDMFFKPACVDFEKFNINIPIDEALKTELGLNGKTVMLYAGKLGGLYLEKEVFEIVKAGIDVFGENFRFLFLTNTSNREIEKYCTELNIDRKIIVNRFVPHAEVPKHMALATFALNPMKSLPSRRHSAPIKDAEYWAMGLPVIITEGIADDSDIVDRKKIGYVLQSLNYKEYISSMNQISILIQKEKITEQISSLAMQIRSYSISDHIYKELYGK